MAFDIDTDEDTATGDDKIIRRAKKRFQRCEKWEADFRRRFIDDVKFSNADPDNGWQWLPKLRQSRELDDKPCLTINKTRQHNLQITNDARQNKPSVKVRPVGDEATYKAAEVFEGIVRHIEYISKAQTAYDTATKFQVEGGIGYWRVVTDYTSDDTFDQEIYIRRIIDPLSVYQDPDIQEFDGSDQSFCFIFEDVPKDKFEREYPDYKNLVGSSTNLNSGSSWVDEDHVRVAEYYERTNEPDQLLSYVDDQTNMRKHVKLSDIPAELRDEFVRQTAEKPTTRLRDITVNKIMWYKIAGDKIIDSRPVLGKYIPVVRVIGEETVVEGKLDRKGNTRNLKDPQRVYNYWTSSATEHVALQTKTPYVGPAASFEGYETFWGQANRVNAAYLPYKHVDDEGNILQRPEREQAPMMAQGYIEGLKISQQEMMMVSGQYESNFGAKSNETSGKAINERQRQGDTATYHYIDNQAVAIRFTGMIFLNLIPLVYDTPRTLRVLAKDGEQSMVQLDPEAKVAYQEKKLQDTKEVQVIFNPSVGEYDVYADVGPAYATQRQEAYNALSQILTQAPDLVNVAGDLLFKAADFPMADELAERLARRVPADVKGEGPSPEMQQLTQQLKTAQSVNQGLLQELAEQSLALKRKDAQKDVDVYKAVTDRLDLMMKEMIGPKDVARMVHSLMLEEQRANSALNSAVNNAETQQ